jgi:hypothetical protein
MGKVKCAILGRGGHFRHVKVNVSSGANAKVKRGISLNSPMLPYAILVITSLLLMVNSSGDNQNFPSSIY